MMSMHPRGYATEVWWQKVDRWDGPVGKPTRLPEPREADLRNSADVDVVEHYFVNGYLSVGDRVKVRRFNPNTGEYSSLTWRVDGIGWSLVIDPTVYSTYVKHDTGEAVMQPIRALNL